MGTILLISLVVLVVVISIARPKAPAPVRVPKDTRLGRQRHL
jgi:hypothetical protein